MAATIIDGKALAKEVRAQIKQRVAELAETTGKKPGLAVVLVGEKMCIRDSPGRGQVTAVPHPF